VLLRHALRNSSIPAITTIGLQFGNILTGAAITEVIFGRAGLGSFLATSITNKNIPVVQGAVVVIGVGYVLINLAVDVVVGAVDPRTRVAAGASMTGGRQRDLDPHVDDRHRTGRRPDKPSATTRARQVLGRIALAVTSCSSSRC